MSLTVPVLAFLIGGVLVAIGLFRRFAANEHSARQTRVFLGVGIPIFVIGIIAFVVALYFM
jgi:hypothetical protein